MTTFLLILIPFMVCMLVLHMCNKMTKHYKDKISLVLGICLSIVPVVNLGIMFGGILYIIIKKLENSDIFEKLNDKFTGNSCKTYN